MRRSPTSSAARSCASSPTAASPDDNPFPGSPVYSRGHRNPEGLAWQPGTGALYASEHGSSRYDEINRIRPGASYGWGAFACDRSRDEAQAVDDWRPPVVCTRNWTLAPSGMTFVDDPDSPWHGDLFVASLRGGHLRRYRFDGDRVTDEEIFFVSEEPDASGRLPVSRRLRDVVYRDGALYVIGDRYGLVRITPQL